MLLYCSDLHNDERAWAWVKAATLTGKYSAFLFGGDALSSLSMMSPVSFQIARRKKFFGELTIPVYAVTGNHDWSGDSAAGIGQAYWIHDLAMKHDHIHTHGLHALSGGWSVRAVDYMEPILFDADTFPSPKTILLTHVPPSGPCAWNTGISFGDDMMRDDLNDPHVTARPGLICSGHIHLPSKHAHRYGLRKTLTLNPGVSKSGGQPNRFEIDLEHESVRFVSGDNSEHEFVLPIFH
jgi:predicted phosphodiesterase